MIIYLLLTITTIPSNAFLVGDWKGNIQDFSSKTGMIYFSLSPNYQKCTVLLFDGNWRTDDVKAFNCSSNPNQSGEKLTLNSASFSNQSTTIATNITGDLMLLTQNSKIEGSGHISSNPNYLSFTFSVSEARFEEYRRNIYMFIILFTLLKTLEFYTCRQILSSISSRILAQSMSLSSIILSSTVDLFYVLWSFEIVGKYVIVNQLNLIEFMILSLSSLVILREKSRIFDRSVKSQSLSRRRHGFSTYMFISALYISTLNSLYYLNVVASNMVFIPHLVKNSRRRSISKWLIGVLIMSQLVLTLSIICWKLNFLVWEPNYYLSAGVVFVVSLQLFSMFRNSEFQEVLSLEDDLEASFVYDEIPIRPDPSSAQAGASCPICLYDLPRTGAVRTSCMHWFHLTCVQDWLRINSVCPVCRSEVYSLFRR